jgi:acyl phosphate:glycerol-3-phosphate acyltransferase
MIEILCKASLSYLLGSILGSLVVGRLRGVDIRALGSGNAGSTNALRTQGKAFALAVLAIDAGKGWVAAVWIPALAWPFGAPAQGFQWLPATCAAAAMLGHVYPIWFGFRGGKAVATLLGALAGLAPLLLASTLLLWLAVVALTGFVSVASMTAALVLPLEALTVGAHPPLTAFAVFAAVLVIFAHRGNLRRLRAGREPRTRRPWRFRRAA